MNLATVVEQYYSNGWSAPLPLSSGTKTPPPKGTTGQVGNLPIEKIQQLWSTKTSNNANVALRMQTPTDEEFAELGIEPFDIIGIDVDHYNGKQGHTNIEKLEAELGNLGRNMFPRSSRRGPDNPGGHSFFKVPRGKKWHRSACADVDVLQLTHRYAVVYPSVVDGLQYKWYVGTKEVGIPSVFDLPPLPEKWVNHLMDTGKDAVTRSNPGVVSSGVSNGDNPLRSAVDWMRTHFYDYGSEKLSPVMLKACEGDKVKDDIYNNGHDTMVSAVHNVLMLGVDGEPGVKLALHKVRGLFLDSVVGGGRRDEGVAKMEFNSALISGVEKISSDVQAGRLNIIDTAKMKELSKQFKESKVAKQMAEVKANNEAIDNISIADEPVFNWKDYEHNDVGFAEMVADYWGDAFVCAAEGGSREFALLDPETKRYQYLHKDRAMRVVYEATYIRLKAERERLTALKENLLKKANQDQISPEENARLDSLEDEIKYLTKLINKTGTTSCHRAVLAQMHAIPGKEFTMADFDSKKNIIGLGKGETLEIRARDFIIRETVPEDRITMSTAAGYEPGATHPAFDKYLNTFLPDEELRCFTQKCLGYSLVSGNPHKLLFIFHGESDTGKTTLLEAVSAALGDYAGPLSATKVFGQDSGGPNAELLLSMNRRMVVLSELGERSNLSADALKRATGNDQASLRLPHSQNVVEGKLQFGLYAATNTPPRIPDADAATLRRMCTIPFTRQYQGGMVNFEDDIVDNEAVRPAIIAWLIEGLQMFLTEGLERESWPAQVIGSTKTITQSANYYTDFVEECCEVVDPEIIAEAQENDEEIATLEEDIVKAWDTWIIENGLGNTSLSNLRKFRSALRALGTNVQRVRKKGSSKRTYKYHGLRLRC